MEQIKQNNGHWIPIIYYTIKNIYIKIPTLVTGNKNVAKAEYINPKLTIGQ